MDVSATDNIPVRDKNATPPFAGFLQRKWGGSAHAHCQGIRTGIVRAQEWLLLHLKNRHSCTVITSILTAVQQAFMMSQSYFNNLVESGTAKVMNLIVDRLIFLRLID